MPQVSSQQPVRPQGSDAIPELGTNVEEGASQLVQLNERPTERMAAEERLKDAMKKEDILELTEAMMGVADGEMYADAERRMSRMMQAVEEVRTPS